MIRGLTGDLQPRIKILVREATNDSYDCNTNGARTFTEHNDKTKRMNMDNASLARLTRMLSKNPGSLYRHHLADLSLPLYHT